MIRDDFERPFVVRDIFLQSLSWIIVELNATTATINAIAVKRIFFFVFLVKHSNNKLQLDCKNFEIKKKKKSD